MRSAARADVRTTQRSKPDESSGYRVLMNWLINWLRKVTDKRYRRAQRKRRMEQRLRAQGHSRNYARAVVAQRFGVLN
jgi:hypothetical protein